MLFVYHMDLLLFPRQRAAAQRSQWAKLLLHLYNKHPQMTVQIAAIRIIKAPFIQGMLVQYC